MTNRRNNRNPRPRRLPRRNRRLTTLSHGSEYVPNADPPAIKLQPWNNIVVTLIVALSKVQVSLTIKQLGDQLWRQLGSKQNLGLDFCMLRTAGWSLDARSISVQVSSLVRTSTAAHVASMEDTAGKNHWARFGWRYSPTNSDVPFRTIGDPDADKVIMNILASEDASSILLHFQCKWRSTFLSPPEFIPATILTSFPSQPSAKLDRDISDLVGLLSTRLIVTD